MWPGQKVERHGFWGPDLEELVQLAQDEEVGSMIASEQKDISFWGESKEEGRERLSKAMSHEDWGRFLQDSTSFSFHFDT